MNRRLNRWPWLIGALVAYHLPWLWHPAAALTFNAYDLAEWVSIHPSVRSGSPIPLVAPFLLRSVLAGIAILCGLKAAGSQLETGSTTWINVERWFYAILAFLLVIRLLPPPDFFRGAGDDPNYRQQFALASATLLILITLAVLTATRRLRWINWLEMLISGITLAAALAGEVMAYGVVRSLQVAVTPGGGIIVLGVCLLPSLIGGLMLRRFKPLAST